MSWLFRSFLPLENPIGFGFQDFVELGFALLIVVSVRLWRRQLLAVMLAFVVGHIVFAWTMDRIMHRPPHLPRKQVSPFEDVK